MAQPFASDALVGVSHCENEKHGATTEEASADGLTTSERRGGTALSPPLGDAGAACSRAGAGIRATPHVAVTAYAQPEDRRRALEAGFDVHLAKPVDLDELSASSTARSAARASGEPSAGLTPVTALPPSTRRSMPQHQVCAGAAEGVFTIRRGRVART